MVDKIRAIPGPLKVVCLINLGFGLLGLVGIVIDVTFSKGGFGEYEPLTFEEKIVSYSSLALSMLVVMGIIEKSLFIRKLLLIFAWLGAVIPFLLMPFLGMMMGMKAFYYAIPVAINVVTIWGFMNSKSKIYFGIPERKWKT